MVTKETPEKYSCSMCPKSYPFFSYFKRHIKQTHVFSIENFQPNNDLTKNQMDCIGDIEDRNCSIEKIGL